MRPRRGHDPGLAVHPLALRWTIMQKRKKKTLYGQQLADYKERMDQYKRHFAARYIQVGPLLLVHARHSARCMWLGQLNSHMHTLSLAMRAALVARVQGHPGH